MASNENERENETKKTKWQLMLEKQKGCIEYNPTQSFALHVMWVVRSPTAAKEMIERGFRLCSEASMRDTPTTLAYIFRISYDQRLATQFRNEIKTIGEHPHYQPSFKSIDMGVPQNSVELKLKHGGINLLPLSWPPNEPLANHEVELDYDPIVLECTEVYLDNRSFYEHSASREWMDASPEILKACRSLKATTYCLGNPSQAIWDTCLEPYLKAVRIPLADTINDGDSNNLNAVQSGISFLNDNNSINNDNNIEPTLFFLEINLQIHQKNIPLCRNHLTIIQHELKAPYMIVLPTTTQYGDKNVDHTMDGRNNLCDHDVLELRWMLSFLYSGINSNDTPSHAFRHLMMDCVKIQGRIYVFDKNTSSIFGDSNNSTDKKSVDTTLHFLEVS